MPALPVCPSRSIGKTSTAATAGGASRSVSCLEERFFLVAAEEGRRAPVFGFIVAEVRAWEFGSAPCGWVFALSVEPGRRLDGVGSALLSAISDEFKRAGVSKIRTMVARDARLPMLFFRSEGLVAGPYIQLEKEIA